MVPGQWNPPSSKICLMTRMLTSVIADTRVCVWRGRIEEIRILLVKIDKEEAETYGFMT